MRNELQKLNGQRRRFRATVERYGSRSNWHGYPETTILLKDVCFASNGELTCDHVWFPEADEYLLPASHGTKPSEVR